MMQAEDLLFGITGNKTSFRVSFQAICRDRKSVGNINPSYRSGHVYEWYLIERIKTFARALRVFGIDLSHDARRAMLEAARLACFTVSGRPPSHHKTP